MQITNKQIERRKALKGETMQKAIFNVETVYVRQVCENTSVLNGQRTLTGGDLEAFLYDKWIGDLTKGQALEIMALLEAFRVDVKMDRDDRDDMYCLKVIGGL